MFVEGLHEKDIFSKEFPFRLAIDTQENFSYPTHWHPAIELLYVEKSNFNICVNNGEYILDEGDIIFISSGDTHGFINNRNNPGKRIFIQFDSSVFNAFGNNNIIKPFISSTFKISSKDTSYYHILRKHINDITNSYSDKKFGFELFLCARIYDILAIIASYLADKANVQGSNTSIRKVQGLEKLSDAFKYIEANYMNNISLSDVARAVGFSEFYFSRMFKDITERNFTHYLNEYRIKQAEQILVKSNMSVSDIAYSVGFNSIVTFNRAFKNIKGCSPSVYKKIGYNKIL